MEGWTGAPSSPLPSPCYYSTLGLTPDSSIDEIRGAYRKLAMQWHPDKWVGMPDLFCEEAKRKFQQIQEAYSVLSDEGKRMLYDVGLYDPHDEHDEGFSDFVLEMLSLMDNVRKEDDAVYTMEDLQSMFMDLVNSDSMGGPYEPSSSLFDCIQSQERVFGKREKHTFPCSS